MGALMRERVGTMMWKLVVAVIRYRNLIASVPSTAYQMAKRYNTVCPYFTFSVHAPGYWALTVIYYIAIPYSHPEQLV